MTLTIETAQFLASLATALGVMFAIVQFVRNITAEKTSFTMQRLDRYHQHVTPELVTFLVEHVDQDTRLSDAEFVRVYWGAERAPLRRGIKEMRLLLGLLDSKRLDTEFLGAVGFLSEFRDDLESVEPYIIAIDRVHDDKRYPRAFRHALKRIPTLVRRYERFNSV